MSRASEAKAKRRAEVGYLADFHAELSKRRATALARARTRAEEEITEDRIKFADQLYQASIIPGMTTADLAAASGLSWNSVDVLLKERQAHYTEMPELGSAISDYKLDSFKPATALYRQHWQAIEYGILHIASGVIGKLSPSDGFWVWESNDEYVKQDFGATGPLDAQIALTLSKHKQDETLIDWERRGLLAEAKWPENALSTYFERHENDSGIVLDKQEADDDPFEDEELFEEES